MSPEPMADEGLYSTLQGERLGRRHWAVLLCCAGLVVVTGIVLYVQLRAGLKLYDDDDEMEQLVAAQLIAHGKHLYRDIFVNHGPVPYMISHFYASVVSPSDFTYVRLSQAVLAVLSCAAIVFSPMFKTVLARIWAGVSYLFLLSVFWNPEGFNIFAYDTLAGYFFVVVVAQLVVPLMLGEEPMTAGTVLSGVCLVLALFCANSNIIATILFLVAPFPVLYSLPFTRVIANHTKAFLLGVLLSLILVGLWLIKFGDLIGYFVYHFYFNYAIYRKYAGVSLGNVLNTFSMSFGRLGIIHSFSLLLLCYSLCNFWILLRSSPRKAGLLATILSSTLLCAAVVFTNVLGHPAYGDANFVNLIAALFSAATALSIDRALVAAPHRRLVISTLWSVGALALAAVVGGSADLWFGARRQDAPNYMSALRPEQTPIYRFIRSIAKKEDDLLVLPFHPGGYVKADRLPTSGNLYYSNLQAEYNRNAVLGYRLDICGDIRAHRPSVIWLFNWRWWDISSLDEHEPCVLSLITQGYKPLTFDSPWHIRNDIFEAAVQQLPKDAVTKLEYLPELGYRPGGPEVLQRTVPLTMGSSIDIRLSPTHEAQKSALSRIALLLAMDDKRNSGEAEIHLTGPGGVEFVRRFALPELPDNHYYYFDVAANRYTKAELRSVTGRGLRVWESHLYHVYTCAIYEYVDGSRRYTPACPIM